MAAITICRDFGAPKILWIILIFIDVKPIAFFRDKCHLFVVYNIYDAGFCCYHFVEDLKQCKLISHTSKIMLKILQAKLQQYMNRELPDVQTGFRRGRGTRDRIANIHCIMEKAGKYQKNIYFCFIDYTKVFDCVDHNKLWKILKEMGIPEHLTCLLRNLYTG